MAHFNRALGMSLPPALQSCISTAIDFKFPYRRLLSGLENGLRVTFEMSRRANMSTEFLHTLERLKRRAKVLRKERGILHTAALDLAAAEFGFQNYGHARNVAGKLLPQATGHILVLSAYWSDPQEGLRGKESLTINLAQAWNTLIRPSQFNNCRGLGGFRIEEDNHLSYENQTHSQERARSIVCRAAATISFIDATGLRPSSGISRAYPSPKTSDTYRIPKQDHAEVWYDDQKRYLITDEPYEPSVQGDTDRARWVSRYDYEMFKPTWPGMYNPGGGTHLYLFANKKNGVPLAPLVEALNKLPPPSDSLNWVGKSASPSPAFGRDDNPNKLDLRLLDLLEKRASVVKHEKKPLTLNRQTILAELGFSDGDSSLWNKLRRMEVSQQLIHGFKIKVDVGVVHLIPTA
jgi:hypothetical protein